MTSSTLIDATCTHPCRLGNPSGFGTNLDRLFAIRIFVISYHYCYGSVFSIHCRPSRFKWHPFQIHDTRNRKNRLLDCFANRWHLPLTTIASLNLSTPDPELIFPSKYPTSCLLGCVCVDNCLDQDEYKRLYPTGESDCRYVMLCSSPAILPVFFPMKGGDKICKYYLYLIYHTIY